MELDLPILLLAHLNRAGRAQQRRWLYIPTLADLKDAWAIEQDADQVLFVCRDSEAVDEDDKRKAVVKVAKNRDWATGHTSYDFDTDIGYFSEVVWDDYLEAMMWKGWKMKDSSSEPTDETVEIPSWLF